MSTLPIKLAKRIAGDCRYSGCSDPALDGSDFCAPHDAHERGRDAGKKRRARQRLADKGVCIVPGCGTKVGRQKRADGTMKLRRCRGCGKKHRDGAKDKRRGVTVGSAGVPGDESDPAWRVDPGTNWLRFRGKGRRGRLTREEQIHERIRSVDFAFEELRKFRRALEQLKLPDVVELPKIQREAAGREAAFFGEAAGRHIEDALDELAG